VFKNNTLLPKIGFTIISVSLTSCYVFLQIRNSDGSWGDSLISIFFVSCILDVNKKIFNRKFGHDSKFIYVFWFVFITSVVLLVSDTYTKKGSIEKRNLTAKNKINSMLDSCNLYEAKVYKNGILFKQKNDSLDYMVSSTIKPYKTFRLLKEYPKYDYLINSYLKCPKDSSELVYIFDNEGTLSVILKLKNPNYDELDDLEDYLKDFRQYKN
jgi:hypothetical protein